MTAPTRGSDRPGPGFFTEFQVEWREKIETHLEEAGIRYSTRQGAWDGQTHYIVKVPTTAHQVIDIYLYADEVALVLAERWSFQETDEPAIQEERLASFVEVLRSRTSVVDS